MKKKWVAIIGSGALIAGIAIVGTSLANSKDSAAYAGTIRIENHSKAEFPSMAKISMVQAVRTALDSVQGQILKTEIEDHNGFLVYGVEVVTPNKTIMDIKVDAGTGKVLSMDKDKGDEDKHESGDQADHDR